MALSLSQVKKRSQQLTEKQVSKTAAFPVKKRALSPWEDVVPTSPQMKESDTSLPAAFAASNDESHQSIVGKPTASIEVPSIQITQAHVGVQSATPDIQELSEPKTEQCFASEVDEAVTPEVSLEAKTDQELETKLETKNLNEQTQVISRVEPIVPAQEQETVALAPETHKVAVPTPKPERIIKVRAESKPIAIKRDVDLDQRAEAFEVGFPQLSGIQRRLVLYVFSDCVNRASLESSPITVEHLSLSLGAAYHSIKKSVDRLQQKCVIERAQFKNGRGGWTQYRISRPIYQELMRLRSEGALPEIGSGDSLLSSNAKLETNWRQPQTQVGQPVSEPQYKVSPDLPEGWGAIDFECLSEFGFTKHHLKQIAQQMKLPPQTVQDSINFFAFDMKRNGKAKEIKGEPLNYFMGIVRKGMPYVPPANFVAPEDEAQLKYLKYLEDKQRIRVEQEHKILDLEFMNWKASGDLTDALKAAPEYTRGKPGPLMDAHLKAYFDERIRPTVLNKFGTSGDERSQIAQEIQSSLGAASV